jgi:hypothetical protein
MALSKAQEYFASIAPKYMQMFMRDFDCHPEDAAAVFGNAAYESLGFTKLQEIKPVVPGSKGGYGWFQWTGPRRRAFEAYCKRNSLEPSDPESNYKFLFVELTTTEKNALPALKAASGLNEKVIAFEKTFERAGVKAYAKRFEWAQFALSLLDDTVVIPDPITEPAPSKPLWQLLVELVLIILGLKKP